MSEGREKGEGERRDEGVDRVRSRQQLTWHPHDLFLF
jgi:hypothetical protein